MSVYFESVLPKGCEWQVYKDAVCFPQLPDSCAPLPLFFSLKKTFYPIIVVLFHSNITT